MGIQVGHDVGLTVRERDFWNRAAPPATKAWRLYEATLHRELPPNTQMAVDFLGPLAGRQVLEFACGAGTLACVLAARGARVTAVDLSPVSLDIGRRVADRAGLDVTFCTTPIDELEAAAYDGVIGIYALDHVDVATYAPALARRLPVGGRAAFVETMAANPVLRLARRHLVGRLGVPRSAMLDEHPLTGADVETIRAAFGSLDVGQARYQFLSMLDHQIDRGRHPQFGAWLRRVDDRLAGVPGLHDWSYWQVLRAIKD